MREKVNWRKGGNFKTNRSLSRQCVDEQHR